MNAGHIRQSKFLSLVLRHKPDAIGISLDPEGWASIEEILEKSAANLGLSRERISEIVRDNDKQRFSISEDGQYIRANQGHSIKVDLGLGSVEPPETLFHGTATRFLASILEQGLLPRNRQHVHLSADIRTARKVGIRHGKLALLKVGSGEMARNGHLFYQSENGVWLTDHVPCESIEQIEESSQ